ncbi:carbohydrate ABC transporter permease [Humibacter ginsenosidimutans]|uniref:Carbohydrate ABC transporter permease n=1 Tax=Humibacter ginsenosidimutans TaxID=2599293 RepID=A0A5B8M6W1_9MICO|nr:carbohydrate ABC transporter permease [Humibacter ginsenosidimutans]QDZ16096.1 carbohydrate ABC transporter permease [Humibacter ginsenosidimutans]
MKHLPSRIVTTVLLLAYAVPLLYLVLTSLKNNQDVVAHSASLIFVPSLQGYVSAFQQGILGAGLSTILIAGMTTVVCLVIGLPTAYGLARSRSILIPIGLSILIILQMIPQTATLIPLYQVLGSWGMLGSYLGLIVADAAMLLPFTIILLRPFFASVPLELEEAAAMDGATKLGTFARIVLPVVRNGVMTVGTLLFIMTGGEFIYAVSFLSNPQQYPLSATVAQQISQYGVDWPALMAIAVLASIPTLIVFAVGQRTLVRGLSLGAVK